MIFQLFKSIHQLQVTNNSSFDILSTNHGGKILWDVTMFEKRVEITMPSNSLSRAWKKIKFQLDFGQAALKFCLPKFADDLPDSLLIGEGRMKSYFPGRTICLSGATGTFFKPWIHYTKCRDNLKYWEGKMLGNNYKSTFFSLDFSRITFGKNAANQQRHGKCFAYIAGFTCRFACYDNQLSNIFWVVFIIIIDHSH